MQPQYPTLQVYQIRVWIRQISPAIWRRLLVRSDSTIADLHNIVQIAFGWAGDHLHRFVIRGKEYGVAYVGGIMFSDNPRQVRLDQFRFRLRERFLYEYDFYDLWQHEIRVKKILPLDPRKTYPVCTGGARTAPPEDCGGPWAFMELRENHTQWDIAHRLVGILEDSNLDDHQDEFESWKYWLNVDKLDRRALNRKLKQSGRNPSIVAPVCEEVLICG